MRKFVTVASAAFFLLTLAGVAFAQNTPIDDIQVYDVAGSPASPYDGQTVTIQGKITVLKGTYNGGTHYIQDATGGITFFDSGAPYVFDYGDEVQITGTIGSYSGEIQINPSNYLPLGSGPEVEPTDFTVGQVVNDYETVGTLAAVIGTIGDAGGSSFNVIDGADTMIVYIDSDTGIDLTAVADGDLYKVIGPIVNYNGTIEMKCRRQSDLIENPTGDTVPVVENPYCDSWTPLSTDPIEVLATIMDDGTITDAKVYYRDDSGDSTGVFSFVSMVNVSGDQWSGTIPAGNTGAHVDYYIEATDDGAQTVTLPASAPAGWYEVAIGFTPIYDVQYAHPDSVSQSSAYNGEVVNIQGIVTAGTGDVVSASKFIVQDGSGPFSAVLVYEGSGNYGTVYPGDLVKVGGYIEEYFGLTEMNPHSSGNRAAVEIVDYNLDLPTPVKVATNILRDDTTEDGNPPYGEPYESVWVRVGVSAVLDTLGYGDFIISDTGARVDSVEVDPTVALSYQPLIGDYVTVVGFMDYDYGDFQISPYRDDHIVSGITGVDDPLPAVLPAGGFVSIAPNPFNPKAEIKFALTRDNLAQLNIYNIRGELVTCLHSGVLPAGEYTMNWAGVNSASQRVASGTYFARLRIGSEVYQVRKLSLVK